MFSEKMKKLIDIFSKFPTVGKRTAIRFVFYILKLDQKEIDEMINEILQLRKSIKQCKLCYNLFESKGEDICPICSDLKRDKSLICIVEKEMDLLTIEKTGIYHGLYFIIGGTIGKLKDEKQKEQIEKRINVLIKRIKENNEIKEVILALNPTLEGQRTEDFLRKKLKDLNIKTTKLGRGIPFGGELEYADEETLNAAFEGRK
ncbi:MAG: recombination mediator RecR [Minisyncoccia bacterium]